MSDVKVTGTAGAAGSAGQNASATNYGSADASNSAEAYGGAGGSGGGNGGGASAGVYSASAGATATAVATSFGGAGGANSVAGGAGGSGGIASNTGAIASGFNAYATAKQTGGAGGSGYIGGTGADSTLTNAVSGATAGGRLRLHQIAIGGASGQASNVTAATQGGAGTSNLTFADTTASSGLYGTSTGTGGAGGNNTRGAGGAGGTGTASVALTGSGSIIYGRAFATGGVGGDSSAPGNSYAGGAGGSSSSSADTKSTSTASNYSETFAYAGSIGGAGGAGISHGGAGGVASSTATVSGTTRYSAAKVEQTGGAGGGATGSAGVGGAGASSTLNNAVSGTSTGGLGLNQYAYGGAGGSGYMGGAAGNGSSSLTYNSANDGKLIGRSFAGGGAGGSGVATGAAGGAATAHVVMSGQNYVYSDAFASGGYGGAGSGSANGRGGVGGTATGSASATTISTSLEAYAYVRAFGGNSGNSSASNFLGPIGGVASGSTATATGFNARANVIQRGGNGGNSYGTGGAGGYGASSTLSDAASGTTTGGTLYLEQQSFGGAGGSGTGNGGGGGSASATLTFSDTTASSLTGYVKADGGSGGNGGNLGGFGGAGSAMLTMTGVSAVKSTSFAVGGNGAHGGYKGGLAGSATANAAATSTGLGAGATATALATAGAGNAGTGGSLAGANTSGATASATTAAGQLALADAVSNGDQSLGNAQTTATTHTSGPITTVSAIGNAPVGDASVESCADSDTVPFFGSSSSNFQIPSAEAFATAAPESDYVSSATQRNSLIQQDFNGGLVIGAGVLGAKAPSGSETDYHSEVDWTVNTTTLAGDLLLALPGTSLADTGAFGTGFDSLGFTVTVGGSTAVNQNFASLAAAQAYFSDNVIHLGAVPGSTALTVDVKFDEKISTAGSGFATDFLLGATSLSTLVLGGAGNTVAWIAGAPPVTIDSGLTASGSATLTGATVTISSGFLAGDTLNFTNQNGITGSFSGNTLTLSGTASLADYQAALESVTYDSTNANPASGSDTQRVISWQVMNGAALSSVVTSTINVSGSVDTDTNMVPAFVVDVGGNAVINAAISQSVSFTVAGLDDETGTASFTDGTNSVTAAVSGNGTFSVDLSSLKDGPINSSLLVSDPAGNSLQATGNVVTLDTENGVAPVLTVAGGQPAIGIVVDHAVTFTVSGLDDETGTAVFSDANHHSVSTAISGDGNFTVDLAALDPTTVTSTLAVSDPAGNSFSTAGNSFAIDSGPAAGTGAITVGHDKIVALFNLIKGLIAPGIAGDSETLQSVSAARGTAALSTGGVTYTAPSTGPDTVSYTVEDQYGDTASGVVNVTVDPGPTAGTGSATVGQNQNIDLTSLVQRLVTPGIAGDSETVESVSAVQGAASLNNGVVTYTAPSSGTDTLSYTVADQYGDSANGAVDLTVDPGPTAGAAWITVSAGATTDLTSYLLGLDTPGIAGDRLSITGDNTAGTKGTVTLASGDLTYTAPASGSDSFGYTVSDQYGDTASALVNVKTGNIGNIGNGSGTVVLGNNPTNVSFGQGAVTVVAGSGNDTITGGNAGDTVIAGNGNDSVTLGQGNNTISLGGGNDNVTVGNANNSITITGSPGATDTIKAGNGNNVLTLGAGTYNVTVGNGNNEFILGSGTYNITDGTGVNLFELSSPQSVLDVLFTSKDELVFKNSGFDLGADNGLGTWPPQPIASSLFSPTPNGTFTTPANRFAYNSSTGQLFYDPEGNTPGSPSFVIADLTNRPQLSAGSLLFSS